MNSNIITEDETERVKKEESLRQLSNELISAQQRIEELEDTLDSNHELRMRDIDYQKAVITDLVNELQQINEEEDVDTDEVSWGWSIVAMAMLLCMIYQCLIHALLRNSVMCTCTCN